VIADADDAAFIVARCNLASFVELAVGRQVGLGDHTQNEAAVDDHRSVVDAVPKPQRRTDGHHRHKVRRTCDHLIQSRLDRVQQGVLHDDVFERIARQRQFGVHRDPDVVVVARPRDAQYRFRVGPRVGDRGVQRAGRHPHETLVIGGMEVHPAYLSRRRVE
jgi:hypothetical protein